MFVEHSAELTLHLLLLLLAKDVVLSARQPTGKNTSKFIEDKTFS
jgi:hypothetical protein